MQKDYYIDDTEASLIVDDFTKERSIQITKVAGSTINLFVETFELTEQQVFIDRLMKLDFQFAFSHNSFYLRARSNFSIVRTNTIYFLFDNGSVIEKKLSHFTELHFPEYTLAAKLREEEMKLFATTLLNKWKYVDDRTNTYTIGSFRDYKFFKQYPTSEEGQYLFLLTARQLIKQVLFHFPQLKKGLAFI